MQSFHIGGSIDLELCLHDRIWSAVLGLSQSTDSYAELHCMWNGTSLCYKNSTNKHAGTQWPDCIHDARCYTGHVVLKAIRRSASISKHLQSAHHLCVHSDNSILLLQSWLFHVLSFARRSNRSWASLIDWRRLRLQLRPTMWRRRTELPWERTRRKVRERRT